MFTLLFFFPFPHRCNISAEQIFLPFHFSSRSGAQEPSLHAICVIFCLQLAPSSSLECCHGWAPPSAQARSHFCGPHTCLLKALRKCHSPHSLLFLASFSSFSSSTTEAITTCMRQQSKVYCRLRPKEQLWVKK